MNTTGGPALGSVHRFADADEREECADSDVKKAELPPNDCVSMCVCGVHTYLQSPPDKSDSRGSRAASCCIIPLPHSLSIPFHAPLSHPVSLSLSRGIQSQSKQQQWKAAHARRPIPPSLARALTLGSSRHVAYLSPIESSMRPAVKSIASPRQSFHHDPIIHAPN